jgi:hypothetical protein
MKTYTGEDFSGQSVVLTEQTRFIRCKISANQIVDNNTIGWELIGCEAPDDPI